MPKAMEVQSGIPQQALRRTLGMQARLEAGARHERTLEAVACMPNVRQSLCWRALLQEYGDEASYDMH